MPIIGRLVAIAAVLACGISAQSNPAWTTPIDPFHVVGNLYYVGSKDLAAYLVVTPSGNILINSNLGSSVPLIEASIEKLGFRFGDTKILLISHAHYDHCAGSAEIVKRTAAKYMVMDADVPAVEDGGKSDFQYGSTPSMLFAPVKVDRTLHDGDEVKLGGAVLVAHLTPGHTKGCTTWTLKAVEGGKSYNVVIVGSPNVNAGFKLVNNAAYPRIAQDYERTFQSLKALPCDYFLGAHGAYFGLLEKLARVRQSQSSPFIDPAGYKGWVANREQAFQAELKKQQGKP